MQGLFYINVIVSRIFLNCPFRLGEVRASACKQKFSIGALEYYSIPLRLIDRLSSLDGAY